jgi:porin
MFFRFGMGDKDTNPVDWDLKIGLGGRGLFPGRANDTYGIGTSHVLGFRFKIDF